MGVGFEFKRCPFGKKGRGVMATVGQPLRRRGGSIPTGRLVRSPRASQRLHPRLDPAEERSCPSGGLQVIPRFALTPSPSPEADSPIIRGFLLPGHRELQSPPTSNEVSKRRVGGGSPLGGAHGRSGRGTALPTRPKLAGRAARWRGGEGRAAHLRPHRRPSRTGRRSAAAGAGSAPPASAPARPPGPQPEP